MQHFAAAANLNRFYLKYGADVLLWTLAMPLAYWLRLEGAGMWEVFAPYILLFTLLGLGLKMVLAYAFGLHRQSWRKVSVPDLVQLGKAVVAGTVLLFVLAALLSSSHPLTLPRSVPLIDGLLAFLMMGGARLGNRLLHEQRMRGEVGGEHTRVLLAGAGEAGTLIVREMLRHPDSGMLPVGFLDDDEIKRKQRFMGLPVFGAIDDLPRVVERQHIDQVLVAMPSAPGPAIRHVVELAREAEVSCRTMPSLSDIITGQVSISQIREVDLEDLLRRDPVELNLEAITGYLQGRVVLVTGAGGSIGSELVRQLTRFGLAEILLLGRGENSLYATEREMQQKWPHVPRRTIVADVRDRQKLAHVFAEHCPQVVFHAAAHKHVPMMEMNPDAAIFNNVMGTRNLVELAVEYGVERFVNISTDKAVNPTSIMGASKRVTEHVVDRGVRRAQDGQVLISVRFGNVLGSRGSVVPLFKAQIERGGPVTVTHPEMTRYFMTIPEAAQLVIEAGGIGENGRVYVLDMGEPVKILDLAQDLIRLSGLEPGEDIKIAFTGIRPGEKLYEEVMFAEEEVLPSQHKKIFIARRTPLPEARLEPLLDALFEAAASYDNARIRRVLQELISTYRPG